MIEYFKGKPETILPTVLILIDIASGVIYSASGDWRRGGYWFSAALLTGFVTY